MKAAGMKQSTASHKSDSRAEIGSANGAYTYYVTLENRARSDKTIPRIG